MATAQGTGFEPWGGLQACSQPEDCLASATAGMPASVGIATCVDFGNRTVHGFETEGRVCVCSIIYQRFGPSCEQSSLSAVFAVVQVILVSLNLALAARILHTIVMAKANGMLRNNAVSWTIICTFLATFCILSWIGARLSLCLGMSSLYQMNIFGAGFSVVAVAMTMSVCSLSWQEILNSARTMKKKGTGKPHIDPKLKAFVLFVSTLVGAGTTFLIYIGRSRQGSQLALLYFIICFFVYWRVGSKLKALLQQRSSEGAASSNASGDPVLIACDRIRACIRRVMIFISVFTVSAVGYSVGNTDQIANSTDLPVLGIVGLTGMQLSVIFAVYWISNYAAGPLREKLSRNKVQSSNDKTSVASSALAAGT